MLAAMYSSQGVVGLIIKEELPFYRQEVAGSSVVRWPLRECD